MNPRKRRSIGHLITQYAVGSSIRGFLLGVSEPNAVASGYLVGIGEVLIGLATLAGLLFRIACVAGLMLNLTFFLSATWTVFPFYFGSDIVFGVLVSPPFNWATIKPKHRGAISRKFTALSWFVWLRRRLFPLWSPFQSRK